MSPSLFFLTTSQLVMELSYLCYSVLQSISFDASNNRLDQTIKAQTNQIISDNSISINNKCVSPHLFPIDDKFCSYHKSYKRFLHINQVKLLSREVVPFRIQNCAERILGLTPSAWDYTKSRKLTQNISHVMWLTLIETLSLVVKKKFNCLHVYACQKFSRVNQHKII